MSETDATKAEALQAAVHLAANGNPLSAFTANDILAAADLFHAFLKASPDADVEVTVGEPF